MSNKSLIPKGIYCYSNQGVCPYWSIREDRPGQTNGYCSLLGKGDWELVGSNLWDQVKECGENDENEDE